MDLSFCNKTHELNSGCNFAGEAHSLKIEKILFQGKSDYQKVMVFQVHEVEVNFEVTITFFCMLCYLSIFSLQCHDVFCSHQHMARFLFWMELFSSQKGTNVPTKKWSLIFLFALFLSPKRSFILLWVNKFLVYWVCCKKKSILGLFRLVCLSFFAGINTCEAVWENLWKLLMKTAYSSKQNSLNLFYLLL